MGKIGSIDSDFIEYSIQIKVGGIVPASDANTGSLELDGTQTGKRDFGNQLTIGVQKSFSLFHDRDDMLPFALMGNAVGPIQPVQTGPRGTHVESERPVTRARSVHIVPEKKTVLIVAVGSKQTGILKIIGKAKVIELDPSCDREIPLLVQAPES